ncbi:MAG: hypothetical protein HY646_13745 [Acidobacteria bacterium]|nr:hypothetical protein [Acidobacteriota bacterium]
MKRRWQLFEHGEGASLRLTPDGSLSVTVKRPIAAKGQPTPPWVVVFGGMRIARLRAELPLERAQALAVDLAASRCREALEALTEVTQ